MVFLVENFVWSLLDKVTIDFAIVAIAAIISVSLCFTKVTIVSYCQDDHWKIELKGL